LLNVSKQNHMNINGYKTAIKLGYYNHGHYVIDQDGQIYVSFDIAIWADRFIELCDEFVVFLNRGVGIPYEKSKIPKSFYPLNNEVKLVDIGLQRPHWQKVIGIGLNKQAILDATSTLDWIIIQGPTPQQNVIAKSVHSNCKIATLLVGLWKKWPNQMFRQSGLNNLFKEQMINLLKWYNQYQTKILMNKYADLPMGNNPAMPIFYKCRKPFTLVSKGLVKESEIQFLERKPLDKKLIKLVFFSRLDPEKNMELILDAMADLKSAGRVVELKAYGGTPMKQYLDLIRKKIVQLGLEELVYLMGELPNHKKLDVFQNADIYIFNTCTTEGFPRTIWEAMATRIPIVCANYPGADQFFKNGEVHLFEQNNKQDLAKKILELSDDDILRKKTIQSAYNLLQQNTLEKSTENLVKFLHSQKTIQKN
jgi:glycosyltransferase involved in cell wall biosynthesis